MSLVPSSIRYAAPSASSWATRSTMSGMLSTAPTYASGGISRSASMSSRNRAVSRIPSTTQSSPSRAARSSNGSSTSVTFCTYRTRWPASRHARTTRSKVRYVAAWPRWVASYGVIPQTYIRAPSGPGRVGCTPRRAVSYSASGRPVPGSDGTSGADQDSTPQRVAIAPDGPAKIVTASHRRPRYGRPPGVGQRQAAPAAQPGRPLPDGGDLLGGQVRRQRPAQLAVDLPRDPVQDVGG